MYSGNTFSLLEIRSHDIPNPSVSYCLASLNTALGRVDAKSVERCLGVQGARLDVICNICRCQAHNSSPLAVHLEMHLRTYSRVIATGFA